MDKTKKTLTKEQIGQGIINTLNKEYEITGEKSKILSVQKSNIDGKEYIVNGRGAINSSTNPADAYFQDLVRMVVSQAVNTQFRGTNILFTKSKEAWINGLKQYFTQGILPIKQFGKTVVINDFNPADNTKYQDTANIDNRNYIQLKIPSIAQMVAAFTNPATLATFMAEMVLMMKKSFAKYYQDQQIKLISSSTGSVIPLSADIIVDTTGATNEQLLQAINVIAADYATASDKYLGLNLVSDTSEKDESLIYSAAPGNLKLTWNVKKKAQINTDVMAKLFHAEVLKPEVVDMTEVNFDAVSGVDVKPDVVMMDVSAIDWGFEIENGTHNFLVPKGQQILEVHNWDGYYRNFAFPVVVFRNLTSYPISTKDNYILPKTKTSVEPYVRTVAQIISDVPVVPFKSSKTSKTEESKTEESKTEESKTEESKSSKTSKKSKVR